MNPEENQNQHQTDEELQAAIAKELSAFLNNQKSAEAPKPQAQPNKPIQAPAPLPEKETETPPSSGFSLEAAMAKNEVAQKPPVRPIVRTYKSDVEETVQEGHISSVNIALAQNERARRNVSGMTVEGGKKSGISKNIIIIVGILVLFAALAAFVPYFLVQRQANPSAPVETVPSGAIITVDTEEKINLSDINLDRFATTIKERVDQSLLSLGQVKNIYFTEGQNATETVITASRFLSLLKAHVPDEIARTLKDQYMFGAYSYNGIQRFLILKVGSYDTAFAGMLSWEPDLWQDFKEAFELSDDSNTVAPPPATTTTATTTATTSSSTEATSGIPAVFPGIEVKSFQDASYFNKDARVVKDSSGNVIFLYSLIDNNTVLIATSVNTMKEIIDRVTKANVVTQ